jgi:DEAD/DEAH box helicase domain-containing protein
VGDVYYWMAEGYPAERVTLRNAGPDNVVILDASQPDLVQALGTVERGSAPQLVHAGAVYLHDGQAYLVDRLDWEMGQAFARQADVDYYTRASGTVEVRPADVRAEKAVAGARVSHGEVQVTTRATSYRKVRFYTQETLGWGEIDLPEQTMLTTGYWFVLCDAAVDRLRAAGWWQFDPVGYRGPNWQEQRDAARARDEYRCRHCGAPERSDRQHDIHHLTPFRDFGYVPGENERYRAANQLDNLVTLCRVCHRRAENAQRFQGALTGVGHVLGHVAPLFLMCDYRDIGIQAEAQAAWSRRPTVTVYEHVPAGVGFSATLYRLHDRLLETARQLIDDCDCDHGCPSCVGPVDEVGADAKAYTLAILEELQV